MILLTRAAGSRFASGLFAPCLPCRDIVQCCAKLLVLDNRSPVHRSQLVKRPVRQADARAINKNIK